MDALLASELQPLALPEFDALRAFRAFRVLDPTTLNARIWRLDTVNYELVLIQNLYDVPLLLSQAFIIRTLF